MLLRLDSILSEPPQVNKKRVAVRRVGAMIFASLTDWRNTSIEVVNSVPHPFCLCEQSAVAPVPFQGEQ